MTTNLIRVLTIFLFATGSLLLAKIDGTIINRTSSRPQANVSVTLLKPGQEGMKTIGTTTSDAEGRFLFEKDQPGGGPQLLQASYKGVNYNKLLTPNIPTAGVSLEVFEPTTSPSVVRVAERMMLIEPSLGQIGVGDTFIVQNDSKTTYSNGAVGSVRFFLPPAANGQVRVNVQGPQGMPLPRAAEKTDVADIYKVDYPIKPGETEFEVSYNLPAGTPFTLRSQVAGVKGMPSGPVRLVAPPGVTLAGKDVQNVGTEPKTQATIYTVIAADRFAVDISGIGSLHPPQAEPAAADGSESPALSEGPPAIYRHLGWVIALAFAVLGVGFAMLFRNSPARSPSEKS